MGCLGKGLSRDTGKGLSPLSKGLTLLRKHRAPRPTAWIERTR